MPLKIDLPSPLEYFASLVQSDDNFPLLEAAASLAQDDYPELDIEEVLGTVDALQARLQRRVPADATALQRLRALGQFFFHDLRFAGNVNHYDDPENSYLNVVLRTRRGIPISLAVVWLELASGLGLAVRGVSFPAHFMVKVNLPEGQVVIDPMSGQSLSREDLSERLAPLGLGASTPDVDTPLALYMRSASPREIIARMLNNLKAVHTLQDDRMRLLAVQNRLVVLQPKHWALYRERAQMWAALDDLQQAGQDLHTYLEHAPDAQDAADMRAQWLRWQKDLG